jgi:hypothetical protein
MSTGREVLPWLKVRALLVAGLVLGMWARAMEGWVVSTLLRNEWYGEVEVRYAGKGAWRCEMRDGWKGGVQFIVVVSLLVGSMSAGAAAALCVKTTLPGALTLRPACLKVEIQIGSFDGQVLQFSGINVQIVDGSGDTGGQPTGAGI